MLGFLGAEGEVMKNSTKTPSERRRFPVGVDPRRDQRRADANLRQTEYDALTTDEKIARTKSRRGNSARELRRLET